MRKIIRAARALAASVRAAFGPPPELAAYAAAVARLEAAADHLEASVALAELVLEAAR